MRDKINAFISTGNRAGLLLGLAVSGLLTGAFETFPSFPGMLLQWIALVPACLALYALADRAHAGEESGGGVGGGGGGGDAKPKKRRPLRRFFSLYGYGFVFFMSEYIVIYHWFLSMYPLEVTGMSRGYALAVVLLGWIGLSVLGSLGGALIFAAAVMSLSFCRRRLQLLMPFAAASAYPLFEWFETQFWTGVPWNRLGLSQFAGNFTATLMTSSFFGPYFTSFLIVLVSALTAYAIRYGRAGICLPLASGLFAANLAAGLLLIAFSPSAGSVTAAALQGNYSSTEKWNDSARLGAVDKYAEMTYSAADAGAGIIVWPETAVTYNVTDGSGTDIYLSSVARNSGSVVAAGCFEPGSHGSRNVLRIYLPDGTHVTSYVKRHLVPFGEYIPHRAFFERAVPPLTEIAMLENDLEPGSGTYVFDSGDMTVGCLICFDSIYEDLARESGADGAQMLLLSTNDSWFAESKALYMHEAQSRLRAIENGVPVVRSANTGISSVTDRFGRVIGESEPSVEATVTAGVELPAHRTLYSYLGNSVLAVMLAVCVFPPLYLLAAYAKARLQKKK